MSATDGIKRFVVALLQGDKLCSGVSRDCEFAECTECGARDCPHKEPLHYLKAGCPVCDTEHVRRKGVCDSSCNNSDESEAA
jgi:hypothetical protein